MNRRRYALWYHEWQSMRWFLLISVLCAITTCVLLQQSVMYELPFDLVHGYDVYGSIFTKQLIEAIYTGGLWIFPFFAIMSAFHFRDKQTRRTREYFMSLPYEKNERFWIKVAMGYGIITVFCMVLTVGVLIVRSRVMPWIDNFNAKWPVPNVELPKETVEDVLCTLFVCWLLLLALYSIFVLMQTVVNHGVLAAVFSVIATLSPFCALAGVMNIIDKLIGYDFFDVNYGPSGFYGILIELTEKAASTIGRWSFEYTDYHDEYMYYEYYKINHDDMWYGVITFSIVLLLCTILAWVVWKRQDEAKAGFLVSGKIPRFCVSIAVSLGAALFVSVIFFMWLGIGEFIKYTLVTIGLTIALWFILKKRAR